MTLYAACGPKGQLQIKRVPLNHQVQVEVQRLFEVQHAEFLQPDTHEIPYDGNYKPDEDEVLVLQNIQEIAQFNRAVGVNATSFQLLDTGEIEEEDVKALFVVHLDANGASKVLIQAFSVGQILRRKFSLISHGNQFRRMDESAFSLSNHLAAVVEAGSMKFRSDHTIRRFVDLREVYRIATDDDVRGFAQIAQFDVQDEDHLLSITNNVTRRLIANIMDDQNIRAMNVTQLTQAASATGLNLLINNGNITIPTTKHELRELLKFLSEDRYSGPISGQAFESNSKRPA